MRVFQRGPGADGAPEMGYEAESQPKTSGWMPSETCAADGVHGDNLNGRKKPQLGLAKHQHPCKYFYSQYMYIFPLLCNF